MIEVHGDDLYNFKGKIRINFSSNIFSHADLSGLKAHLAENLDKIQNYPEPEPYELEEMIAAKWGVYPQNVMVTNGTTEAIYLIASYFRGANHKFEHPTFQEYEAAATAFSSAPSTGITVNWICNPNNPDGRVLDARELLQRIKDNGRDYFVVDQSYARYTMQPLLSPKSVLGRQNCLLLYSMTKDYCIPGLRLGYIIGSKRMLAHLQKIRPTWSVNALAVEAGKYLLEHDIPNFPDIREYMEETQRLRSRLNKIRRVVALETHTNFMMVRISQHLAQQVKKDLAERYAILVRDCSNFKKIGKLYIRVAAQTPDENDDLVYAIKDYLS